MVMTDSHARPFAIQTSRLVLLPSYLAIKDSAYRRLYSRLHGTPEFTEMAFGPNWGIRHWDDEAITSIIQREIDRSWRMQNMGDFAVGLRQDLFAASTGDKATGEDSRVLHMDGVQSLGNVEWIGYVGVRDATTTSMPAVETHHPTSRPWTQMIELRYGFDPSVWGKGYGTEAAKAVLWWCEKHIGGQRFIAETEMENMGSGNILKKCGFEEIRRDEEVIWGVEGEKEWERWAEGVSRSERGPIISPDSHP